MILRISCVLATFVLQNQSYFIHSLSPLYYYNAPVLATQLTDNYCDRTCTGKCGPVSLITHDIEKPSISEQPEIEKECQYKHSIIYLQYSIFKFVILICFALKEVSFCWLTLIFYKKTISGELRHNHKFTKSHK